MFSLDTGDILWRQFGVISFVAFMGALGGAFSRHSQGESSFGPVLGVSALFFVGSVAAMCLFCGKDHDRETLLDQSTISVRRRGFATTAAVAFATTWTAFYLLDPVVAVCASLIPLASVWLVNSVVACCAHRCKSFSGCYDKLFLIKRPQEQRLLAADTNVGEKIIAVAATSMTHGADSR